jgi:hypothetical protein
MPLLPLKCYELRSVPQLLSLFIYGLTFESFKEFGGAPTWMADV